MHWLLMVVIIGSPLVTKHDYELSFTRFYSEAKCIEVRDDLLQPTSLQVEIRAQCIYDPPPEELAQSF